MSLTVCQTKEAAAKDVEAAAAKQEAAAAERRSISLEEELTPLRIKLAAMNKVLSRTATERAVHRRRARRPTGTWRVRAVLHLELAERFVGRKKNSFRYGLRRRRCGSVLQPSPRHRRAATLASTDRGSRAMGGSQTPSTVCRKGSPPPPRTPHSR